MRRTAENVSLDGRTSPSSSVRDVLHRHTIPTLSLIIIPAAAFSAVFYSNTATLVLMPATVLFIVGYVVRTVVVSRGARMFAALTGMGLIVLAALLALGFAVGFSGI